MNKYVSTVRKEKSGNEESHFIFNKEIKKKKTKKISENVIY